MTSADDFRRVGKELVDVIADYVENIREREVAPDVQPGDVISKIPKTAPESGESWESVLEDVHKLILPSTVHWQSPHFHAYYPAGSSYPSILGDMLSSAIGVTGFTWLTSPVCTELEMSVTDWLGRMVGLPEEFLFDKEGGGGVIHGSASEANAFAVICARERIIRRAKEREPSKTEDEVRSELVGKLVMYTSQQSHCSGVRAGLLAGVKVRSLPVDENYSMRGCALEKALTEDLEDGLVPFCVIATSGTTSLCTFDNLLELGKICSEKELWLHVDGAYAGAAFICPEFRNYMQGIEYVDSFNLNPHKWLLVNFDCSVSWFKAPFDGVSRVGSAMLDGERFFREGPVIEEKEGGVKIPDYRHWQIPFGRRFRSLKLWFVLRLYGRDNLRQFIRKQVLLAKHFEDLITTLDKDSFKIFTPTTMGMVSFVWKDSDLTEKLFRKLNARRKIHLTRCVIEGNSVIRFVICSRMTEEKDVEFAVNEIEKVTKIIQSESTT